MKKWLKWVGKPKQSTEEESLKSRFLLEIINSQFNLITDPKVKNKIVEYIADIPSDSLGEKILKSYLYLMSGNITRSDNFLREIIKNSPRKNWAGFTTNSSLYHRLAKDNISQILAKFSKHPADRRSFELFSLYMTNFTNDEQLLTAISGMGEGIEDRIFLRYVETMAPSFVHYLRLNRMSDERRIQSLRDMKVFPLSEQSFWEWPFLDVDPLVSEAFYPELTRLEKEDQLWFIYLMDNEKISDLYIKRGGKYLLSGRRAFLRSNLSAKNSDFMLSLFKLIEIGDIDANLVSETLRFIINE